MKTRVAIVAALLTFTVQSCTVHRFPGSCKATAPTTTYRTKNKAFGWEPTSTTIGLAATC